MSKAIKDSGFSDWKPEQLPDLSGKTFVITGGNSGIGLEAARMLGQAGADLILACRSPEKAESARQDLADEAKGAIHLVKLDLSDLSSVRSAADEVRRRTKKIDGLINNAGIMQTPESKTRDGFELQVGTNHLGHFLWTSLLLDLVEAAKGRVVVVSSIAHKYSSIKDLEDLMSENGYTPSKAYFKSKLANLMYALELDRRLKTNGNETICIACHPGYSNTNLQSTGPKGLLSYIYAVTNPLFSQSSQSGAIPTVLAAAGKEAQRGAYYGPTGMGDARGPVGDAAVAVHALNRGAARQLWRRSEELIGEDFELPSR